MGSITVSTFRKSSDAMILDTSRARDKTKRYHVTRHGQHLSEQFTFVSTGDPPRWQSYTGDRPRTRWGGRGARSWSCCRIRGCGGNAAECYHLQAPHSHRIHAMSFGINCLRQAAIKSAPVGKPVGERFPTCPTLAERISFGISRLCAAST